MVSLGGKDPAAAEGSGKLRKATAAAEFFMQLIFPDTLGTDSENLEGVRMAVGVGAGSTGF